MPSSRRQPDLGQPVADWSPATMPDKSVLSGQHCRLEPLTLAHGVIEVGHINFAPASQRTPAATEAMYLMMRQVFDVWGYRRYEWKCNDLNNRSEQAAVSYTHLTLPTTGDV